MTSRPSKHGRGPSQLDLAARALDHAADAYLITDTQGRIIYANPACLRRFEYTAEQLLGHSPNRLAHRGDGPNPLLAVQERLLHGEAVTAEIPSRTASGRVLPVDVSCSPIRDDQGRVTAFLASLRDLSDRRRAEEAELVYRELFERAGDYIIVMELLPNSPPIIVEVNQAGLDKLGYTREQLIGQPITMLDDPATAEHIPERAQRLAAGEALTFEVRHVCADGSTFPIEVSAKMIEVGDRKLIYAVERDLSERHRMQEEFTRAQKMEAIGLLASGVAHDLNNVLAAVLNNALVLRLDEHLDPEAVEVLDDMVAAAERGGALTRNLLDFARQRKIATGDCELSSIATQVQGLLERVLPAGVRLDLRVPPHPVHLRADSAQIHQAILNLCLNASDAIAGTGTIELAVEHTPAARSVIVSDTGTGMDEDTLQRAREPFFTTKATGKGTGLGLAMVSRCVEGLGGELLITSQLGAGTRVELRFPHTGP